jgi:tRNA pseudouridine38-40 synthase
MRYFFEISYQGTHYSGWQSQPNARGIQAVVEDALSKILRSRIEIVASGRTDAGVHCEQQFFHADIPVAIEAEQLRYKLNSFLPKDIAIQSVVPVLPEAHARYDAVERAYEYRIMREKNPFLQDFRWHYFKSLNLKTMNEAAALLTGAQDFESFSKVNTDVNHFLCDIKRAQWTEHGNDLVFGIAANRFLRGMVRAIVGTLINVGSGMITVNDFSTIVKSRDRRKAGANVPPQGLFLVEVKYPESVFIQTR